MKILYLTPWYPSEKDAMLGLFVQKHAEAVRAQGCDVRVIHSLSLTDTWRQWKALRREGWMPDVVQLNVIQKQGLLALWLKKRYGVPYVIVEHWTGYLEENPVVQPRGWHTRFMKRLCAEAEVVMPVSKQLAGAMQALGFTTKRWEKINNVVDDFFFENAESRKSKVESRKTFLNITCFDEPHKNVKGLLNAAKTLFENRQDWQLVLVGTGIDYQEVRTYADTLHFPEGLIEWTGELKPQEVAERLDKADIFVLSSRFENAPVVISESLAKGVPVIATRVGGIPEMVDDESGILVPTNDDEALARAMDEMLDRLDRYAPDVIRLKGEQYSYAKVGKKLMEIYQQAIHSSFKEKEVKKCA